MKAKKAFLLIDALLLAALLTSATLLIVTFIRYERDRALYSEAERIAFAADASATPEPSPPMDTAVPAVAAWTPPAETPPITIDFAAITEKGEDVCGWLYSEGTPINYPVVRYSNNSYYLTHAYDGTRSDGGALFVDTRCSKECVEPNIVIYGHRMKNGAMFGSLPKYQRQSYYDEHPVLYFLTPAQNYRVEIFAAWLSDSGGENFPVYFASDSARSNFVASAVEASGFASAAEYRSAAQMLSLVTCAYSDYVADAKFQVNGWLIPIG